MIDDSKLVPQEPNDRDSEALGCDPPAAEIPTLSIRSTSESTSPSAPVLPHGFGDYELLEELGRGGMGVVFKARQISLNRIVCLKLILAGRLASAEEVIRFQSEAAAAANLNHPGIIPVYEVGEHEGQHYFSMAFVEGESLAERLERGPLPPREAAALCERIGEAVHYAHQNRVIHRDLKPANVLLDPDGAPVIGDFGLAKRLGSDLNLTGTGEVLGTPGFMSPEQAEGKTRDVTTLSDVYACGAILYCTLTGEAPFQGTHPLEVLRAVVGQEPVPPRRRDPTLPRDLDAIALKALEKVPERRYASAHDLASDLRSFLEGNTIMARPVLGPERFWRSCRRRPLVTALSSLAILLLVAVAVISTLAYFELNESQQVLREQREEAREQVYVARARLASQAWRSGQIDRMTRLLGQQSRFARDEEDLRGWEWFLLQAWLETALHDLPSPGAMKAVWSPDGLSVATLTYRGEIAIHDAKSWQERHRARVATDWNPALTRFLGLLWTNSEIVVTHSGGGTSVLTAWDPSLEKCHFRTELPYEVAFPSPDGMRVAHFIEFEDKLHVPRFDLAIWDRSSGASRTIAEDVSGAPGWSPSGSRMIVVESRSADVTIYSGSERVATLEGASGSWRNLHNPWAWTGDERFVACAEKLVKEQAVTRVWEAATGRRVTRFETGRVGAIAGSPVGSRLATASRSGTIRIWDVETETFVTTIRGRPAHHLAFSPDESVLLSLAGESLRLWDTDQSQEYLAVKGRHGLDWHPGGAALVFDSGKAISVARVDGEVVDRREHQEDRPGRTRASVSPSGEYIAVAHGEVIQIHDSTLTRDIATLEQSGSIVDLEWSPTGRWLASASATTAGANGATHPAEVVLWSGVDFSRERRLPVSAGEGRHLAWVGAERLVVVALHTGTIWDTSRLETVTTFEIASPTDLVLKTDRGRIFLAVKQDGRRWIEIRDDLGRLTRLVRGGTERIEDFDPHPLEPRLATVTESGAVQIWDLRTDEEVLSLGVVPRFGDPAVQWNSDGTRLAVASGVTIRIWDASRSYERR